jgi:hypothetical protein
MSFSRNESARNSACCARRLPSKVARDQSAGSFRADSRGSR